MNAGVHLLIGLGAAAAWAATAKAGESDRLSIAEVERLARRTVERDFPRVDPLMLRAIAEIESARNPKAVRPEPQINDASAGLMQTLLATARWLAGPMGKDRFGTNPELADLLDPRVSMYYGAAMLDWLSTWRGQDRPEHWIVQSYNGGPGNFSAQTERYYERYEAAKARLVEVDNGPG